MDYLLTIFVLGLWMGFAFLIGKLGTQKKIGFVSAFLLSIFLSPFIAYMIVSASRMKNPRGCFHCGNTYNEAEFCGVCGKNEQGLTWKELNSK